MTADLDLISKLEAEADDLKVEAAELKKSSEEKTNESRNVRNTIIPVVESIVRENGLEALTDKRIARHINRAFQIRRHDYDSLRELTKELFASYKNEGAQLLFNSLGNGDPEFRVRLEGYDTAIPLPERFPEILEAFSGTLKFVTPSQLTPEYDTELVEVREGWDGGWKVYNRSNDLPPQEFATVEEALAEAMTQLKFYFTPKHLVTGTFTLSYT